MKQLFIFATIALALWGCSQERIVEEAPDTGAVAYDPAKIITIVTGMEETRGTPITSATAIPDMGLFCSYTGTNAWDDGTDKPEKMFNTPLKQTGGVWTYTGTPVYWEAASAGDQYTFFAYSPYADAATNGITVTSGETDAGVPTLKYTVPTTDVALQPDLMVAVPKENVNPYSTVPLQMKHALTCIEFQIAGNGEQVVDVSITGVYLEGTLKMDGDNMDWATSGSLSTTSLSALINASLTTPYTTTTTLSTNLMKGDGALMMVPQTLQPGAKVTVTYTDKTIDFPLTGTWVAGERRTYNIRTEIMVFPEALVIPDTGTDEKLNNIEVSTSKPNITWTLETTAPWLDLSLDPTDPTKRGKSVTGTGPQTVYTFASANATGANLTTIVTLNGTTTKVVDVTQLYPGSTNTVLADFYVGAFWRAEETGERILRNTANNSAWIVDVLWMDANWAAGDILLAPGLNSAFATFDKVNDDPDNVENYQVLSTESKRSLSGTGTIEFRVGLKSEWAGSEPARYAVLMLSYGTSYGSRQKIYLRQGHGADYVMRLTDNNGAGTITTDWGGSAAEPRPAAVKFSPYNLTAPEYKTGDASAPGGTDIANHATIPARTDILAADASDYFTEYPTQAGAFFQWAGASAAVQRKAYHPTIPTGAITTGWSSTNASGYWSTIGTTNETCPPGWRRPNDGSTSAVSAGAVTDSEMRQSLWLNPQIGTTNNFDNSVWGYYADGYFDRRAIDPSASGIVGSAVSPNSSIPAYRGRLFFNPTTNASVFIPVAGYRSRPSGQLLEAGFEGNYWSSSSSSTSTYSWSLDVASSRAGQGYSIYRGFGFTVRCISE